MKIKEKRSYKRARTCIYKKYIHKFVVCYRDLWKIQLVDNRRRLNEKIINQVNKNRCRSSNDRGMLRLCVY